MEDEEKIGEQPLIADKTQEELKNEEDIGGQSQQESGSLGKFNSPESLLSAYNNLEREFTKKCQKLSELEKIQRDNEDSSPMFEKEEWRSLVADFLSKNKEASGFSREISNEILKDENLQKNKDMLEIAWSRVISKKYKSPEELALDSDFLKNYVLSNEEVKKQVFSSYINDLLLENSPNLMSQSMKGGKCAISPSKKPDTLIDAGNIALNLFKN